MLSIYRSFCRSLDAEHSLLPFLFNPLGTAGEHWIAKSRFGQPLACSNPLTHYSNKAAADSSLSSGSIGVLGHLFLTQLPKRLVGARCGSDGILYVLPDKLSDAGWDYQPISGGGRMHAFDYNLFWHPIRQNVGVRVAAYLNRTTTLSEGKGQTCLPCHRNSACVFGIVWQYIVAGVCLYVLLVVLCFPGTMCIFFLAGKLRDCNPQLYQGLLCACCLPCAACFRCRPGFTTTRNTPID